MLKHIQTWLNSFRFRYVGRVIAETQIVDDDGQDIPGSLQQGFYILKETPRGRRSYRLVGDPGGSPFAIDVKAQVAAWKAGGPLPKDVENRNPPLGKFTVIDGGAA